MILLVWLSIFPNDRAMRGRIAGATSTALARLEARLEEERDNIALWLPVALGLGVALWFALPLMGQWIAVIAAGLAVALGGWALVPGTRLAKMMVVGGVAVALGVGLVWARSEWVSGPVVKWPMVERFQARIVSVEPLPAREQVRLVVQPLGKPGWPKRIRLTYAEKVASLQLREGAIIRTRARLMGPAEPSLPGGYDFARVAWFQGLGATATGFAPVEILKPSEGGPGFRHRLAEHVQERAGDKAGGIAAALAAGDRGAISEEDAEAMRRSGLAHLLSVSGLHLTAVIGFAFILTLRLLALSPALALRWPLVTIAAGAGALTGVGYTLLTGAEVPTVRSCIAALIVLAGLMLGREAITLRLVAAGAIFVLILWPESLAGPSFQLSFAAVTAIIALHQSKWAKRWLSRREEPWGNRVGRWVLGLLATGIVVEVALAPIALFHFHKAGLYGALANMIAIPLTTFIIMPAEALALLFDTIGLGAPFWWITARSIEALTGLAHWVADRPGAVTMLPLLPMGAFAAIIAGGLWFCLWQTHWRWCGMAPIAAGIVATLMVPEPDLLVTGDGKHLALAQADGSFALLRPRAGEYVRDMLAESAGVDGDLNALDASKSATCNRDACVATVERDGRRWVLLATRSADLISYPELDAACREADIVVSDRWLPDGCKSRRLKLDKKALEASGGLSITLSPWRVRTAKRAEDDHPWIDPPRVPFSRKPAPRRQESLPSAQ